MNDEVLKENIELKRTIAMLEVENNFFSERIIDAERLLVATLERVKIYHKDAQYRGHMQLTQHFDMLKTLLEPVSRWGTTHPTGYQSKNFILLRDLVVRELRQKLKDYTSDAFRDSIEDFVEEICRLYGDPESEAFAPLGVFRK